MPRTCAYPESREATLPNDLSSDQLSPDMLLSWLCPLYDLNDPAKCSWLASGLNDVFELTTGGQTQILKVYRAGRRTQEQVLEEVAALLHLHRRGVGVSVPIARRDGAFVSDMVLQGQERPVVLFSFANGKSPSADHEPHCHLLGQTLAEIHNATDDLPDTLAHYDIQDLLIWPINVLEPFLGDRPTDCRYLVGLVERLLARIDNLPPRTLDRGYCHGDFRPANVHLDEHAGQATAFDFEFGATGFRAYDIAYTQTNFHPMALELLWGAPILANYDLVWAAFARGYVERRPLSSADLEVIPLFAAARAILMMATLVKPAGQDTNAETWPPSDPGGLPGGALFGRALQFLRAWDLAYLVG